MHSNRMRTGRSLTVCCSLLSRGGVFSLVWGVCLVWGGSPWSWGFLLGPGGSAWSRGVLPAWGCLPSQGGFSLGGFSLVRGVLPASGGLSRDPPPVNRITDTCKNIALATTSLRLVIMFCS